MTKPAPSDTWAEGAAYERYVGRWSRPVADEFLNWIGVSPGRAWLDVGSGTGALASRILATRAPASVVGVDASPAFVAHAAAHVPDARAEFRVGDARSLPVTDAAFDATVSGLVLNFIPGPDAALAEMRRATRAGGTVAVYLWDYAGGMELMRRFWDAAVALDPAAAALDEATRFPLCRPDALRDLFAAVGLGAIETRAIDVPTPFADFDDYWSPFLGGQGPAPGYVMSLDETRRVRLRDRIRASLPVESDGSIALTARAWAVRGVV
jgi:SAM-dependent methyltransferase